MKQTKNYTVDMVWIPDKTNHNILQTFARNFLSRIQFTKHTKRVSSKIQSRTDSKYRTPCF